MAPSKTAVNPYLRRSRGQRLAEAGRYVLQLPAMGVKTFRGWPRPFRRLVVGLGLVGGIFLAVVAYNSYSKRLEESAIKREWIAIEQTYKTTSDRQAILDSLNRILAIRPADALALKHKASLESELGDPTDPRIMMIVFHDLLKANRTDELVRAAESRVQYEPRDYYAHFLLARTYLSRSDLKAAESHLVAIADPYATNVNINPNALAISLQMLNYYQRDVSRLRTYVSEKLIPLMQAASVANGDPDFQVVMLGLFTETFHLPKLPPDAVQAWPAANEIANLCFDGARKKGDIASMKGLGRLGPVFAESVVSLKNAYQITEPKRIELANQVEERTQRVWSTVLEQEPRNAEAYLGLLMSYARNGKNREAIETLIRGLEVCGDDPMLLQVFSNLAISRSGAMDGYRRLIEAAERNPNVPRYRLMAAQAAMAADRRDLAIQSLEIARKAIPNDLEVQVMQGVVFTGTGYPEKVLESLAANPDEVIALMPHASQIFARALSEIGDEERLRNFLKLTLEFARKENRPQAAYAAALGLFEATPINSARATQVAEFLFPIVEQWHLQFPAASALQAAALVRACELKPGPLDPVMARNAIMACERSLAVDPNNVVMTAYLVRLRIRLDRDGMKALGEIQPLLARIDSLTPEQAEALAMVYNANRKFDDAIRIIQPYTAGHSSGGCWIQLAQAYHGQGRDKDAQDALQRATEFTMTDRERADYVSTRELLSRVKP